MLLAAALSLWQYGSAASTAATAKVLPQVCCALAATACQVLHAGIAEGGHG
jgi:hypothetical protein